MPYTLTTGADETISDIQDLVRSLGVRLGRLEERYESLQEWERRNRERLEGLYELQRRQVQVLEELAAAVEERNWHEALRGVASTLNLTTDSMCVLHTKAPGDTPSSVNNIESVDRLNALCSVAESLIKSAEDVTANYLYAEAAEILRSVCSFYETVQSRHPKFYCREQHNRARGYLAEVSRMMDEPPVG